MAKTDAERSREYRQKKRDELTDSIVTDVCDGLTGKRDAVTEERDENVTEAERDDIMEASRKSRAEEVLGEVGPLDVYSEARWARLQDHKHTWDADRCCAVDMYGNTTPPVPGDPAYQGIAV